MKIIIILLTILNVSFTFAAKSKTVTLEDVVTQVSKSNFKVYENALKVYQAQANIDKARWDLLPKLNLWTIAGMVIDPFSIVEKIPEVAPFLVPGNWFRLEEVKLLYLAENEGYRALWGNELFIAKTLYKNILFDQQILKHVQTSIKDMEKIHQIIKARETFGGVPPGTARDIEIRVLGLKLDEQNLKVLLAQEFDNFTYSLGFSTEEDIQLVPVKIPTVENLKPIEPREYEFRLLTYSPERRQFDHFLSVLNYIKKEIMFSFLGVSQVSRGVAGGVFDDFPIPSGAGLGMGAAMRVIESQKEIMKTQKRGIEETLKRQIRAVGYQYNSDLGNYDNFKRRMALSKESKSALIRRMELGENINVLELSESSRNLIQAETALYAVQYRVMTSMDRVQRLIFDGDYSMKPPLIDSLKGGRK